MTIDQLDFEGRDEFNREKVADKVIQLLQSGIDISPMVIDGDWGTGKTEFCYKLINKLKATDQNAKVLYIDAFQADHADNPLMTILAAVMSLLPDDGGKKTFLEKAIPVARYGLATVGKAAIGHLLKQNADDIADEIEKHLQDAADKAIDASVKALLKDHENAQANLQALQDTLANIASDAPIILFIDELDRCRPDFSVQMLEVIKHTFDVQKVIFVLVTNLSQLRAAINHSYGSMIDAQRYLDKFLKFSFRLPEFVIRQHPDESKSNKAAVEHFKNGISKSPILLQTSLANLNEGVLDFPCTLVEHNNLSLREVEAFIRHLEIYQTLSKGLETNTILGELGKKLLRIFGVYISCFKSDLAESVRKNTTDAIQITAPLGGYDWSIDINDFPLNIHANNIALMLAKDSTTNSIKNNLNTGFWNHYSEMERKYFDNGFRFDGDKKFDDGDNKFEIIKDVINTLDLGKV